MSATCQRQGKMLPIFAPIGQFWRHGFNNCVGTHYLCRVVLTQTDQRQTTKKSALSNSHVATRQPKKRGPKEHDEQHLENDSSHRRLPHRAPAATTTAVMLPPDPQLPPPPLPLPPCCFRCRATAVTVLLQPPSPSPCCCLLAGCHLPLKVMREMGFHSET
jgi:hypothetical protein